MDGSEWPTMKRIARINEMGLHGMNGMHGMEETEGMEWGNQRLAKYQRVFDVEFRDSFPRNAFDKIMKRELREPYWEGRESNIV